MANPVTLFEEAEELLDKKSIPEAVGVLNRIGESPASRSGCVFHFFQLMRIRRAVTLPVEACEGVREEVMKAKEQAILTLGTTLAKNNASEGSHV